MFTFIAATGTSNSAAALAISGILTVNSGDFIRIDAVGFCNSNATQSMPFVPSDNQNAGNVWIQAGHQQVFTSTSSSNIVNTWYTTVNSGSSAVFTMTSPVSTFQTMCITRWTYTGGNWVTVVPGSVVANSPRSTAMAAIAPNISPGTLNVLQSGDMIFLNTFIGGNSPNDVLSIPAGFTLEYHQQLIPGYTGLGVCDQVVTSQANQNLNMTIASGCNAVMLGAALRVVTLPAVPASFTTVYESDQSVYSDMGHTPVKLGGTVQLWNSSVGGYNASGVQKPLYNVFNNAGNGLPGVQFSGYQYMIDSYTGERGTVIAVFCNDITANRYGLLGADSTDSNVVGAYYLMACDNIFSGLAPRNQTNFGRSTEADGALPLSMSVSTFPTWNVTNIQGSTLNATSGNLALNLYQSNTFISGQLSTSYVRPIKAGTCSIGCARDSGANNAFYHGYLYALYQSSGMVSSADFTTAVNRASTKYGVVNNAFPPNTMQYIGTFFQNPNAGINNSISVNLDGPACRRIYTAQSNDGINWYYIQTVNYFSNVYNNQVKDCDVFFYNDMYWSSFTAYNGYDATPPFLGLINSPDCINWNYVCDIAPTGMLFVVAPDFAINPLDGSLHMFFPGNTGTPVVGGCSIYEIHPLNTGLTSWSNPVQVIPVGSYGGGSCALDPFYVYNPLYTTGVGPHQLWYAAEGTLRSVQVASCATMTGVYTDIIACTGNWAGFTMPFSLTQQEQEGPFIYQLPSGNWQIWLDGGNLSTNQNFGYFTATSSGSDPLLGGWNPLVPVNGPFAGLGKPEHGRLILYPSGAFGLNTYKANINAIVPITVTGVGGGWVGPSGTLFNIINGGSGASISNYVLNAATQTATFTLNAGSAPGNITIGSTTDPYLITFNVSAGPPYPPELYYGTPFYVLARSGYPIHNAGGLAFGAGSGSFQNYRGLSSDWGYINLGAGLRQSENKPNFSADGVVQSEHSTVNTMTAQKYIILGFTTVVCGNPNTIIQSPGQSYQRQSQLQSDGYRNTWLKRTTGGWFYQNGQPVNSQYSRDFFGTDKYTAPGRLTYMLGFIPAVTGAYHSRTD